MNKLLWWLIMIICFAACKGKADINKLYNETEEQIELEFKYANVDGVNYGGLSDGFWYRVKYDKIRGRVRIYTPFRLADLKIDETYDVSLNKFHCTETQMCFDNRDIRVIIENAGENYIVHVYKLHRYGRFDSQWEDYVTFHNSDRKTISSKQNNRDEKSSETEIVISPNKENVEGINNKRVFTVVYATSDDGFVNIRERPSNEGKSLGELHAVFDGLGDGVLIEKGDSWSKVSSKGIVGWAYTKYLGFQTWYKGTGDSILIANLPQTCIFENADVDEENYKFATVEKGTIIADSFQNVGEYYYLLTAGTCLYVRKVDVKIFTKQNQ